MKMAEALEIMGKDNGGFMVSFEWVKGSILGSDYFPEKYANEELIKTKEEAWVLACRFAEKTFNRAVNVRVIDANFSLINEECIKNR